jgi:multicomponent Na+:H+ antiporter subunit E
MVANLKLFALYLFLWLIISNGVLEIFPLAFIFLLSFITPYIFTLNYSRISFFGILRLSFWFLFYSLKGGFQVAFVALKPKLVVEPFLLTHHLRVHSAFSISLLASIYSLMPGTLSIQEKEGELLLHILDKTLFELALIERFEGYVFDAFEEKCRV